MTSSWQRRVSWEPTVQGECTAGILRWPCLGQHCISMQPMPFRHPMTSCAQCFPLARRMSVEVLHEFFLRLNTFSLASPLCWAVLQSKLHQQYKCFGREKVKEFLRGFHCTFVWCYVCWVHFWKLNSGNATCIDTHTVLVRHRSTIQCCYCVKCMYQSTCECLTIITVLISMARYLIDKGEHTAIYKISQTYRIYT